MIAAALGFPIGVGLLLAGVVINVVLIAVAGCVVTLACSLWAVTSYQRVTGIITGRPARWPAGGIRDDGMAGRALAPSPIARPLTLGCPLPGHAGDRRRRAAPHRAATRLLAASRSW